MKKMITAVVFGLCVLLIVALWMSSTKDSSASLVVYTIPRNHAYQNVEEKKMTVDVYANKGDCLFAYPKENTYQLKEGDNLFLLNNVYVDKVVDYADKSEKIYRYSISFPLLRISDEDIHFSSCSLVIKNQEYTMTVQIGSLVIYQQEYPLLEFSDVYGNYAYLENELHMVGITICLDEKYSSVSDVEAGDAFGLVHKIEKDVLKNSELSSTDLKNYTPLTTRPKDKTYALKGKTGYYYIPIAYENLYLNTTLCLRFQIEESFYLLEDFTFLANVIHINDYVNSRKAGEIVYA